MNEIPVSTLSHEIPDRRLKNLYLPNIRVFKENLEMHIILRSSVLKG